MSERSQLNQSDWQESTSSSAARWLETTTSDSHGQRPTKEYKTDEAHRERALDYNPRNNPRGNAISQLAYRIAGSKRGFYTLPKNERQDIRATAKRLYEFGTDSSTAASKELTTREGFCYAITHPAFKGCVKLGRAFDPESRLNGYQTGCPTREYELRHAVYFTDCHEAEEAVHARLAHLRMEGEWFYISIAEAIEAIDIIKEII